MVFLKRWSRTSISTLMLLLGRWRTVFWGTMATVSFSFESFEVLVWLSTSDLGLELTQCFDSMFIHLICEIDYVS